MKVKKIFTINILFVQKLRSDMNSMKYERKRKLKLNLYRYFSKDDKHSQ